MANRAIKNEQGGFTIIEVMIVLAIAGLIMMIVFLAIPQLQRSQRNTRRKDVTNRVKAAIEEYSGNNNGKYPTADTDATTGVNGGFVTRYLSNINYEDPQTGASMTISPQGATSAGVGGTAIGTLNYSIGAICSGETATTTGSAARNFALYTKLEGGATYCVDNK